MESMGSGFIRFSSALVRGVRSPYKGAYPVRIRTADSTCAQFWQVLKGPRAALGRNATLVYG
jgi:hypothetical protein